MIEKQTVIDQIEIARSGHVQIRFGLLLVEDGVEIGCQWHRASVEPGGDVDATIAAVNADITSRPELRAVPVDTGRLGQLKVICKTAHTKEVVKAYRDQVEKRRLEEAEALARRQAQLEEVAATARRQVELEEAAATAKPAAPATNQAATVATD